MQKKDFEDKFPQYNYTDLKDISRCEYSKDGVIKYYVLAQNNQFYKFSYLINNCNINTVWLDQVKEISRVEYFHYLNRVMVKNGEVRVNRDNLDDYLETQFYESLVANIE